MRSAPSFNGHPYQGGNDPSFSHKARFLPTKSNYGRGSQNNGYRGPQTYHSNVKSYNNSHPSQTPKNPKNPKNIHDNRYHNANSHFSGHQGSAGQNLGSDRKFRRRRGKQNFYPIDELFSHPGFVSRSEQHFDQHRSRRHSGQGSSSALSFQVQPFQNQSHRPNGGSYNPKHSGGRWRSHDRQQFQKHQGSHNPFNGGQYNKPQFDGQAVGGFRGESDHRFRGYACLGGQPVYYNGSTVPFDPTVPRYRLSSSPETEALFIQDRDGDITMLDVPELNPWSSYNMVQSHA